MSDNRINRRSLLGASAAAAAAAACSATGAVSMQAAVQAPAAKGSEGSQGAVPKGRKGFPIMVGSANALVGMRKHYEQLRAGADPLGTAIEVVKIVEADPSDTSVGLGGLPNEDGVVQLDSACMHGPTHNSGAVGAIENILHPCEVARLVMERTDHCLIVGRGAYEFARSHGHPHVELLTESTREIWMRWKESMSDRDDRLQPAGKDRSGRLERRAGIRGPTVQSAEVAAARGLPHTWGTIHCSALSTEGDVSCVTTTSGLSWKIPGRVGDSPIVGAGLYCDQEAGSAGSTGRGESAILANGSFAIVELMRQGASPEEAGLEVLRRICRQVQRQATWQPALMREDGTPNFGVNFYALDVQGNWAGVTLRGGARFAVADPENGVRLERLTPLLG
jgi:N4-(beta-N-acetylglucosaminyl)-L-asparaginase